MRAATSFPASTRAMASVILGTAIGTAILVPVMGLTFPVGDWLQPAATCAGLLAAAEYYHRRQAPNFVLCLQSLIVLVAFSTVFCVLTYAVAAAAPPYADASLARCDAALGFSAPAVIRWTNDRPWLASLSRICYFSVIPQTVLVIVYFGLRNRREVLDKFLLRFMACGLLTTLLFCFLPAQGTCAEYHLAVPEHYQPILEHLEAIRCGARTIVTWRDAEGLITFPSFHAIWGVLLILACIADRYLRWPMLLLNGLMIVSTVPVGMHYLTDVIAGSGICLVVVAAERCGAWGRSDVWHALSSAKGVVAGR
jgi:membrane-associated phospholipid phosphatase